MYSRNIVSLIKISRHFTCENHVELERFHLRNFQITLSEAAVSLKICLMVFRNDE